MRFKELLTRSIDKQIDLFEIYVKRNCFQTSRMTTHSNRSSVELSPQEEQLASLTEDLVQLQSELRELTKQKKRVQRSKELSSTILKALTDGVYPLQVAEQMQYNSKRSSLADTLEATLQDQSTLSDLCTTSTQIVEQLGGTPSDLSNPKSKSKSSSTSDSNSTSKEEEDQIEEGEAQDVQNLAAMLG